MSKPYPDYAARQYPPGEKSDRRRITKCSDPGAWYASMVGQIITVHYFCSFGAWDAQGRWLWYYDLSQPILKELTDKESKKLMQDEMNRVNEAIAHLNKWDDIPINMQLGSLCEILKIVNNNSALNFCTQLLIIGKEESAKILFDSRKHEFIK